MLPGAYEFRWDAAHIIFLGAFFTVLFTLAACVVLGFWRTWRDLRADRAEQVRWHADFESLPEACRLCRHTLRGVARQRICSHGFDCGTCDGHPRLRCLPGLAPSAIQGACMDRPIVGESPTQAHANTEEIIYGLRVPQNLFYDRGHTWVQVLPNGRLRLGMDALAQKLLGTPDHLELPSPGTRLRRHGTAWRLWKHGTDLRLRSPVDGIVRDVGTPDQDWMLEIEPHRGNVELTHLMHDDEVRPWMEHEVGRFVGRLGGDRLGTCLTDGGELLVDSERLDQQHDPRPLWDDLFLQA